MANTLSDVDLVERAGRLLNPQKVGDRLFGDVAAVLVTNDGDLFEGVCIDTSSGTGFCAEHAAIAAMVTAGQYRIARIVAVWGDEDGTMFVLSPCGRCREFIGQIHPENLDTQVILGRETRTLLRDLLPHSEWPNPF